MTGLLAVTGVILVVMASAYSGLSSEGTIEDGTPGFQITPVTELDSDADEAADDATDNQGEGEGDAAPEAGEGTGDEAPTATPEPPTPTPVLNRLNCDQIRGTDYFSPEERTWFLANCVN